MKGVTLEVRSPDDVLWARQEAKRLAGVLPWRPEDLVRVELIAAELASNLCRHGGGGRLEVFLLPGDPHRGVRLVATDLGPGIADLGHAMRAGCSTAGSFGDGLATIEELADAFRIDSSPGSGTRVEVDKWLR